jgi:hypothetical protein
LVNGAGPRVFVPWAQARLLDDADHYDELAAKAKGDSNWWSHLVLQLDESRLHQFVGDAAHIDLEIEALHRRTREMPDQTARDGSAANELVGKERMDVKDRIHRRYGSGRPP